MGIKSAIFVYLYKLTEDVWEGDAKETNIRK